MEEMNIKAPLQRRI